MGLVDTNWLDVDNLMEATNTKPPGGRILTPPFDKLDNLTAFNNHLAIKTQQVDNDNRLIKRKKIYLLYPIYA
jgi:hypothetical protein